MCGPRSSFDLDVTFTQRVRSLLQRNWLVVTIQIYLFSMVTVVLFVCITTMYHKTFHEKEGYDQKRYNESDPGGTERMHNILSFCTYAIVNSKITSYTIQYYTAQYLLYCLASYAYYLYGARLYTMYFDTTDSVF